MGRRKLVGRGVGLADLAEVQPDVHRSLMELLGFSGDVTDLGLVFQARPLLEARRGGDRLISQRKPCCKPVPASDFRNSLGSPRTRQTEAG